MNRTLYRILRAELWQLPLELSAEEVKDITAVLDEAQKQSVVGLVAHCLVRNDVHVGIQNTARILQALQRIRRQNAKLNEAVARLAEFCQSADIPLAVVKGQTVAALYPAPETRQSGDIDFFCGKSRFAEARAVLCHHFEVPVDGIMPIKHSEFSHDGIVYELHRVLAMFSFPRHQRRFDEIMERAVCVPTYIEIGGVGVPTLPPTENLLFQVTHVYYHILKEGIGFRQFCDMAIFLRRYAREIDHETLTAYLKSLGLYRPFCAMGYVLTECLGLDRACFPHPVNEKWGKRMAREIESGGNFGKAIVKKRGFVRYWTIFCHQLKYLPLTPAEVLSYPFEKYTRRLRGFK